MSRASLDGIELKIRSARGRRAGRARARRVFARWYQPLLERTRPCRPASRPDLPSDRLCGRRPPVGPVVVSSAHLARSCATWDAAGAPCRPARAGTSPCSSPWTPRDGWLARVLDAAMPVEAADGASAVNEGRVQAPVMERYRARDKAGAVDGFMRGVTGARLPGSRLIRVLPAAFGVAVASADTSSVRSCPQWGMVVPARRRAPDHRAVACGRRREERHGPSGIRRCWSPGSPEPRALILPGASPVVSREPARHGRAPGGIFCPSPLKAR